MNITAILENGLHQNNITVATDGQTKEIKIASKTSGWGSSVNGAELLLASMAVCYCNDIYREAAKRNITVSAIEVRFHGEFGKEGEPGKNFTYTASIKANASAEEIESLLSHTDSVAEIHNTLRKGVPVVRKAVSL